MSNSITLDTLVFSQNKRSKHKSRGFYYFDLLF